jgi:hypothetical protein
MTVTSTRPAVPSGPTIGVSHSNPDAASPSEVTTTGRDAVRLGTSDVPRSVLMPSIVSCSFSTTPPLRAPRTSAIFVRMLSRNVGRSLARFSICCPTPQPDRPSAVNASVTTTSTAGTRPIQRSSAFTGGVRTNVRRSARAKGTNTACAQYRTTTTSTHPANVTQGFTPLAVSSIIVWYERLNDHARALGPGPPSQRRSPLVRLPAVFVKPLRADAAEIFPAAVPIANDPDRDCDAGRK